LCRLILGKTLKQKWVYIYIWKHKFIILQCTLYYLDADYSVCGLSVDDSFFNLPQYLIHQIRTCKDIQRIFGL
jgi:hypothetical protein